MNTKIWLRYEVVMYRSWWQQKKLLLEVLADAMDSFLPEEGELAITVCG